MRKKIDFSRHVKEVLNRNNIQIHSLALVGEELKDLFSQQRKKAILLIRNKVFEREIDAVDEKNIDVYDTMLIPYIKKGQLILLVLPSEKKTRYVMQTSVNSIFVDRFRLTALDPRKNKRFSLPGGVNVKIRTVQDTLALRIQAGELRSVRQSERIALDALPEHEIDAASDSEGGDAAVTDFLTAAVEPEPQASENEEKIETATDPAPDQLNQVSFKASIVDIIFQTDKEEQAEDYTLLKEQNPVSGVMVDISLGGMCVAVKGKKDLFFTDQLVVLETDLTEESSEGVPATILHMLIFAVVRNQGEKKGAYRVNLEFLSRLPKSADSFFPKKID